MPRIPAPRLIVCAIAALVPPSRSHAQGPPPPPTCPPAEAHRFDFLIGDWHGLEYLIKSPTDSELSDHIVARNHKAPFDCALEERWDFTPLNGQETHNIIIRTFDVTSKSWRYSGISSYLELYTFESVRTDSGLAFLHTIETATPPRMLRFLWVPTPTGYTEIIHVSTDSGRTWPILRHLNYTRDRG